MPLILISENTSTSDYGTKRRMECKDFLSDNVWIVHRVAMVISNFKIKVFTKNS